MPKPSAMAWLHGGLRTRRGWRKPTALSSRSRSSKNRRRRAMDNDPQQRQAVRDWQTDWDHLDPRWRDDPYPIWDELREKCPIAHTDRFQGAYLPTTYSAVKAIANDTVN